MAKRKRKNNDKKGLGSSKVWAATKIIFLLLIGYGAGWSIGYSAGRDDTRAAMGGSSESGEINNTDNYGRSPGHPHYGHAHP